MIRENKVASKQNVEGSPVPVVNKCRIISSDASHGHQNVAESAGPPGVPVSLIPKSFISSMSDKLSAKSSHPRSVQLVDDREHILFDDCESFADHLSCPVNQPVKVVAIVGNTGDGKSYTMNHTFYQGKEVFLTSASQNTCTIGVWAAYVPSINCILLDTEGMLGTTLNQNQHRRLLLKVFAVADVVIYLTKAPRLHTDMFTFLADASDSFAQHFRPDLEALAKRTGLPWSAGQLGPAVIVFQETRHTDPLDNVRAIGPSSADMCPPMLETLTSSVQRISNSVTQILQNRLADMKRNVDSFSSLHYVGTQTTDSATDFKYLSSLTAKLLKDNSIRAPRQLEHVYSSLHLLNTRFACDIPALDQHTFVEEYFTCPVTCDSCSVRCCLSVGHVLSHQARLITAADPTKLSNTIGCRYNPVFKNKLYYCKDCYALGFKNMVVPKAGDSVFDAARYLYSGYVLECKRHGIIYQSRNLWSGNAEPEETARVHWEVIHVWSGEKTVLQGTHPFSQVLLDGVSNVTKQVTGFTGPSVRLISDLLADSLAPEYWQRNSSIRNCALCKFHFPDPIVDGVDYSDLQSKLQMPAGLAAGEYPTIAVHSPQRYGGRLCESDQLPRTSTWMPLTTEELKTSDPNSQTQDFPILRNVSPYTRQFIVDVNKHHCRACGRGVCAACSTGKLPVLGFGLNPVRICNECYTERHGRATSNPDVLTNNQDLTCVTSANNSVYTGRKALEVCSNTVNSVPPVLSMIKETLKSLARPDYWTPDYLCKSCTICCKPFGSSRRIHHCRACGRGVCEPCSPHRQPVPLRGLDLPHRVCNECFGTKI